jgi:hypothetical protein
MVPFKDLSSARPTDVMNRHSNGVTIAFRDPLAVTGSVGLLGFGLTMIVLSFQKVGLYSHSSTIMGRAGVPAGWPNLSTADLNSSKVQRLVESFLYRTRAFGGV